LRIIIIPTAEQYTVEIHNVLTTALCQSSDVQCTCHAKNGKWKPLL